MDAGPGPGLARPDQVAGKTGLEMMQAMMRGEIPYPPISKTLDFLILEVELGRALHQKQHSGEEPSGEEISRFTELQDQCDANTAILSFIEAQDVLRGIAEVVTSFVGKSLERGEVPAEAEVFSKGCGEGCGCH